MTYDPERQLGSEPSPELINHAKGLYALFAVVGLMLIGLLIFTIGHASYEGAKEEQDMYCAMVAEGTWPDYNGNYERICE